MNDVEEFICNFKADNSDKSKSILSGSCSYWFAMILYIRFLRSPSTIMIDADKKHFGTRVDGRVYDFTGDATNRYSWTEWLSVAASNPDLRNNIINECILFKDVEKK